MTFASPYPPVDIPDVSVHDFLFGSPFDPDRRAFVDGPSGRVATYGQLVADIGHLAGALAGLGLGAGDVVALHSPNSPEFAVSFHGVLRSGATVTTVPALANEAEIVKQLLDSRTAAVIAHESVATAAVSAAKTAGIAPDRVAIIGGDGRFPYPTLAELLAQHADAPDVAIDPATHIAALPYSSGTTGRPKGVRLSHRNLVANIAQIEDRMGVDADDVVMAVLPFFHIYGMTCLLNQGLRRRATLVTMPKFDLPGFLGLVAEHRATYAFIAPPIAVALAKQPMVDDYDLSSLRKMLSGAAPLDRELSRAVAARLNARIRQGYGMSEMSPVSHFVPMDEDGVPPESTGRAVPNTENRLIDPLTGADIGLPAEGVSAPGELWVRGPNVMVGYLGDDAATAEILDADGFLHTGDIATVDADGNITIVDRIKELIKYKGYQVAPAELEALLLTHPDIADAAVIGVRDADGEEVPKAFVVRQSGAAVTGAQVVDFVAERVAPYKKVRAVEFIDAVPKSASGKILRRELRDR